ncbi:hypothetical protein TFLX_03456 [Thermoflexales bacterium]|nr:hypothetical protein TFLX_03456 [Thermoflexales bacterium]
MSRIIRSLILFSLLLALPLPVSALSVPRPSEPRGPTAPTAAAWYDGGIQYSSITNCVSIIQGFPYQEYGIGTYTGFYANPEAGQPSPNTVYYVHVVVAGLGNACSGQRAYIDLGLPANTTLAIDATNKVRCYYDNVALPANECPQTLQPSSYNSGAYWIPSVDAAHANLWPIPQGRILEIQVPVRSSAPLSNSPLQAHVWALDGNSSPWLRPQTGIYVFSTQPTIFYAAPATISITVNSAYSIGYLYNYGLGGNAYFDLGTTTSYGLFTDGPVAIPAGNPGTGWKVWTDWTPFAFQPDTLYHFRLRFEGSDGQTYLGADQTFRTLPAGQVTIGNGQAASCTSSALNSALATAQEIRFDCGTLPITITLLSAQSIGSPVMINGGNKVTLDANHLDRHFLVQAGAALTLTQITLQNGQSACGGAVSVAGNARLTLNEARLISNHSSSQGGAVCVNTNGTASIANTLFMSNTAGTHGGAIGNYGSTSISNSKFTGNTASTNGGGIDTTVALELINTTFISNTAGFRGGGVNNYVGAMSISNSSFSWNVAGAYGGGVSNDAGVATIGGSTFNDNAAPNGGGLQNSGTLNLTNSTVSGNRASAGNGGGVYWVAGSIGLVNTTLINNLATAEGGNVYAGGSANISITLKNTLVAQGAPNNCDAAVSSQGNNLDSANTCGFNAAGDKINVNPQLGPLQNNGGATWTQALLAGSPAIDAGTNSGCPITDQRGVARPIDGNRDGNAVCDIGAYEAPPQWQVFLPLVKR